MAAAHIALAAIAPLNLVGMKPGTEIDLPEDVDRIIHLRFADLSPRLRQAARFIVDNPQQVALRSMRDVAARAEVDPSTMVRLAQDLGFDGYEALRDLYRRKLLVSQGAWSGRARRIRDRHGAVQTEPLLREMQEQNQANLAATFSPETLDALEDARRAIEGARNVFVIGLRSCYPIAFFFHYALRLFSAKSVLLTGTGGTFADDLRFAHKGDAVLLFSYRPYARDALVAAAFARSRGTKVIAVLDSRLSALANDADITIVVSNASTSLLPTMVPFMAVAEALATLMMGDGDAEAMRQLSLSEEQLDRFRAYADEERPRMRPRRSRSPRK